jgi:hypothetical protein
VDEMNFRLDQVSTNVSLLHFDSLFFHLSLFLRGHSLPKREALHVRGLSKDRPRMHIGRKQSANVHTRLRPKKPSYTLKRLDKNESARTNSLLNCHGT